MSRIIGNVGSINGEFYAKSTDGSLRKLSKGDEIYEDEVVLGDKNNITSNSIVIAVNGGNDVMLLADESQLFDKSLLEEEFAENETVSEESSVDAIIENISESDVEDVDDIETAAGEDAGNVESTEGGVAKFAESNNASVNIEADVKNENVNYERDTEQVTEEDLIEQHMYDEVHESRRQDTSAITVYIDNVKDIVIDNTREISGKTQAGIEIIITDKDAKEIARTIADENGDFSVSGDYLTNATLTITATDNNGNVLSVQTVVNKNVDSDDRIASEISDSELESTQNVNDSISDTTSNQGTGTAQKPTDRVSSADDSSDNLDTTPTTTSIPTAEVEIVAPANVGPTLSIDSSASVDEDGAVLININATDVDGKIVSTTATVDSSKGSVTVNNDGTITFTPVENFNGEATITVTTTDDDGASVTKTSIITVNDINDLPTLTVESTKTVDEDGSTAITFSALDVDGTVTTSATALHGTVVVNDDGTISYNPDANFNGTDTITVTATDDDGAVTIVTSSITVNDVNDAPTLTVESTKTVDEDGNTSITFSASDVDGTVTTSATADHGSVTVNGDGTVSYTPDANYNGVDTITVTTVDDDGATAIQTSSITVNDVNDAPTLSVESTKTIDEDGSTTITFAASDIDGTVTTTATADHGTVVVNSDGTISYTPDLDYNGSDTITVTTTDDDGVSVTKSSDITINPVDDAAAALAAAEAAIALSETSQTTADASETVSNSADTTAASSLTAAQAAQAAAIAAQAAISAGDDTTLSAAETAGQAALDAVATYVADAAAQSSAAANYLTDATAAQTDATAAVTAAQNALDKATAANEDTTADTTALNDANTALATANAEVATATAAVAAAAAEVANANTLSTAITALDTAIESDTDAIALAAQNAATAAAATTTASQDSADASETASNTADTTVASSLTAAQAAQAAAIAAQAAISAGDDTTLTNAEAAGQAALDAVATYVADAAAQSAAAATYLSDAQAAQSDASAAVSAAQNALDKATAANEDTSAETTALNSANTALATANAEVATASLAVTEVSNASTLSTAITTLDNAIESDTDAIVAAAESAATAAAATAATSQATADSSETASNTADATAASSLAAAAAAKAAAVTAAASDDSNVSQTAEDAIAAAQSAADDYISAATAQQDAANTYLTDATTAKTSAQASVNAAQNALDKAIAANEDTTDETAALTVANAALATANAEVATATTAVLDANAEVTAANNLSTSIYNIGDGVSDIASVVEDTQSTVSGNVLTNDTNANVVTTTGAQTGTYGTITINADGSYDYALSGDSNVQALADGEVVTDVFTYLVEDNDGNVDSVDITISVTGTNDAATVSSASVALTETDAALSTSGTLISSDIDNSDNAFTASSTTGTYGNFAIDANGAWTFESNGAYDNLNSGQNVSETFNVTSVDGTASTVTIRIDGTDDTSILSSDTNTVNEDNSATGNVLANDSDADDTLSVATFVVNGDATTYTAGQTAVITSVGSMTLNADGSYIFTPDANYNGSVPQVTYTTNTGSSDTLDITVSAVNDAPVAVNDTDRGVSFDGVDDSISSTALDGYALNGSWEGEISLKINSHSGDYSTFFDKNGFHGVPVGEDGISMGIGLDGRMGFQVKLDGNTSYIVKVDTEYNKDLDIKYGVDSDNYVYMEINGVKHTGSQLPAGYDASNWGSEPFTLGTRSVDLSSDFFSDIDVYNLTLPDGTIYDFEGSTLDERLMDKSSNNHDAVVHSGDPSFVEKISTSEDNSLVINANELLANDYDIDGDTLTITNVSATGDSHGTVVLNIDGTITYTPEANYNGEASFEYTVSDGNGGTSTAIASLNVASVNDVTVTASDTNTVNEDTTATGNVLTNDSDVDNTLSVATFTVNGDAATYNAGDTATIASVGAITLNADGSYTFTPVANWNGSVPQVTYVTNTGSSETLDVSVTAVDDATVTAADTNTVNEDNNATGNVLTNDSDVDNTLSVATFTVNGDAATYNAGDTATIASVGTVLLNADGSYTFTPVANWNGSVPQVTYVTNTGSSDTLDITLTAVDDATVTAADTNTVNEDNNATGNVLTNDSDVDNTLSVATFTVNGDAATYNAGDTATIASVGAITLNADGSYTFTPVPNWNGSVPQVTYVTNTGSSETLDITVNPAPQLVDSDATANLVTENIAIGTYTGVTLNAVDAVSYSIVDSVPFSVGADGKILVNGALDYETQSSYTFDVKATKADTTTLTTSITINLNDISGNIVGTIGEDVTDTFTGTTAHDVIIGTDEEELIDSIEGNDKIYAGAGDDVVNDTLGHNTVYAGEGDNTINLGQGNEYIDTGSGDDIINSGEGAYLGVNDHDKIYSGAGNDTIVSGYGHDQIVAGSGDDTITAAGGENKIDGGLGNDTITTGDAHDYIMGGDGNDIIDAGLGNNRVNAGAGDDSLKYYYNNPSSYIDGGTGNDTLEISDTTAIDFDRYVAGTMSNIETIVLSDGSAQALFDISVQSVKFVTDERNLLRIDGENIDQVTIDTTSDWTLGTLITDAGTGQTYQQYVAQDASGVTLEVSTNIIVAEGGSVNTYFSGISGFHGDETADNITGTVNADNIISRAGDDIIDSGAGNDDIFAGAGNDTITTSAGTNYIDAGEGTNTVTGGTGNDDIFAGAGNDNIAAGDGANLVFSGAGDDIITSGSGKDAIHAGTGNDTISSGDSDDIIYAGEGNDIITTTSGNNFIDAGAGNDTITSGAGIDAINAGAGNDIITGGSGKDFIHAGAGDDTINITEGGGTTKDETTVLGGDGRDTVVFAGNRADYTVTYDAATTIFTIKNTATNEKQYIYDDVEFVQFADVTVTARGLDVSLDSIITNTGVGVVYNVTAGSDGVENQVNPTSEWFQDDVIVGSSLNDTVYSGSNRSYVDSGAGDDTVSLGQLSATSTIRTGDGNDKVVYGIKNTTDTLIDTGAGDDRIESSTTTASQHGATILTGDGNDYTEIIKGSTIRYDLGTGDDTIEQTYETAVTTLFSDGAGIDGGTGNDTFILNGLRSDYRWVDNGDGTFTVFGLNNNGTTWWDDGTKFDIKNIETLQFDDQSVIISPLAVSYEYAITLNAGSIITTDTFSDITLSGLPAGVTLVGGTDNGDGTFTVAVDVNADASITIVSATPLVNSDLSTLSASITLTAADTSTEVFTSGIDVGLADAPILTMSIVSATTNVGVIDTVHTDLTGTTGYGTDNIVGGLPSDWDHDAVITGTDADDTINVEQGDRQTINSGAGDDLINLAQHNVITVDTGVGSDKLVFGNATVIKADINTGAGDDRVVDSVTSEYRHGSSVNTGEGDDYVELIQGNSIVYNLGDGNDTIARTWETNGSSTFTDVDTYDGNFDGVSDGGIDGGAGEDTFILNGLASDFTVTDNGDGTFRIAGLDNDGITWWNNGKYWDIKNIEYIQFTDQTVQLEALPTQNYQYSVSLHTELVDTDGSETLSTVTVDNIPTGAMLINGTTTISPNADGSYTFTPDVNGDVSFTVASYSSLTSADLSSISASVTATETNGLNTTTTTTATVDLVGTAGVDTITGTAADELIDGGLGADVIDGGAGNDTAVYDGTDTVDGGTGTDTLLITSDMSIDFSTLNGNVSNIEAINLGTGVQNVTNITLADVMSVTDTDNILRIDGDVTDTVQLDTTTNGTGQWTLGGFKTDAETGQVYQEAIGTDGVDTVTLEISTNVMLDEI